MTQSQSTPFDKFYQSISAFPLNMEIGIMQIGRQSDFLDECIHLKLAFEYLKQAEKSYDSLLTAQNFTEYSNYINTALGSQTRKQQSKKEFYENMDKLEFKDVGDTNSVIFPVTFLDRFNINHKLLNHYEEKLQVNSKPELKERLNRLRKIEMAKEEKLKERLGADFYNKYLKPKDSYTYCYLRALALFYFQQQTPDENKTSLQMEINILSYLNFFFPNGKVEGGLDEKQTFEQIYETSQYMDTEQEKKFLQGMQLDPASLLEKVKEEQGLKRACEGDVDMLGSSDSEEDENGPKKNRSKDDQKNRSKDDQKKEVSPKGDITDMD